MRGPEEAGAEAQREGDGGTKREKRHTERQGRRETKTERCVCREKEK